MIEADDKALVRASRVCWCVEEGFLGCIGAQGIYIYDIPTDRADQRRLQMNLAASVRRGLRASDV